MHAMALTRLLHNYSGSGSPLDIRLIRELAWHNKLPGESSVSSQWGEHGDAS